MSLALLALCACSSSAVPIMPGEAAVVVGRGAERREVLAGTGRTYALWASGSLPKGMLAKVRAMDGVLAAGYVRQGLVDLQSVSRSAHPLPRRPGSVLGVSVMAVDPFPLAHSRATAPVARALSKGHGVLTATAARIRGLDRGGAMRIAGATRSLHVEVGSVLEENDLFDQELVLSLDRARGLGLAEPRAMVVAIRRDAEARVVPALLAAAKVPARTLLLDGDDVASNILPIARVKQLFGEYSFRRRGDGLLEPDPHWVERSIVKTRVPVLGVVSCHRLLIPQLAAAMTEIRARGLEPLIESYNGCYVPRVQRGNPRSLSRHSFGIAVDINASRNRYGDPPTMDRRVIAVMQRWGFTWGGRWLVPDGMHFEFVRFVRPA